MTLSRQQLERLLLLTRELKRRRPWKPLKGPQMEAYNSEADIIGYGGAAGGGKTDLAVGKALTQHRKVMIMRRVGTELTGIEDRIEELIGDRKGYNSQKKIWRYLRPADKVKVQIELASVPNLGDEKGYQGRPRDLLVLDEAANFLEAQARFLMGWVRSTVPGQKQQTLMCFNPPTSADGRWIIDFFGPWLDPKHPNPAQPGELRWIGVIEGKDIEVTDNRQFVIGDDGEPNYDFDPKDYKPEDIITPKSRTFIPSRVADNPHLMGTGYMAQLQALPEPLRSQMLYGDFMAGVQDDPWQVIPTAWILAAQERWTDLHRKPTMDSLGADIARGGADNTVLARRHGDWFDRPLVYPGAETPDGPAVAGLVIAALRDRAPIHLDIIGVGSSPYDFLKKARQQIIGVNVAEKSLATDQSGRLSFFNLRSELAWKMREALDPANNRGIALPPDKRLARELAAFTWSLSGSTIKVESREEVIKRLGYSPDFASAYFLALMNTPRVTDLPGVHNRQVREYDPYASQRS